MAETTNTGGEPEALGKCIECGTIYPVRLTENGDRRVVGTEGACRCGNDEFEAAFE